MWFLRCRAFCLLRAAGRCEEGCILPRTTCTLTTGFSKPSKVARYLRAKATLLGHDHGLPWWDLIAPVGAPRRFAWPEAVASVHDAFATYSPRLAGLVDTAVAEAWIDAGPRSGKVGGAFCMSVQGGVSRVLCNFDGSFDAVQTLAHELGHAYHNLNLGDRTPMPRTWPQ